MHHAGGHVQQPRGRARHAVAHHRATARQVNLRAVRRLADEGVPGAQPVQQRGGGGRARAVDPGGRRADAGDMRARQVVRVATADRHQPLALPQPGLPVGQRLAVEDLPRAVPHFDAVLPGDRLEFPRGTHRTGVVARGEVAQLHRAPDRFGHQVRRQRAKVDPLFQSPDVPVPFVRGDLAAGDQHQVARIDRRQGGQMADRVVIGDRQEVQPQRLGGGDQVARVGVAVAVVGMAVQLAAIPPVRAGGQRRMAVGEREQGGRGGDLAVLPNQEAQRNGVVAAFRRALVEAERDVPLARVQRPRQIARRGVVMADEKLAAGAAGPAPEAAPGVAGAALVEQANVQRVAAGQMRIGADRVAVFVAHLEPPHTIGHLEGDVVILLGLVGREIALQPLLGPRRAGHWSRSPFLS